MPHSIQKLATEFGQASSETQYSTWRSLAEKSLRGAEFESSLIRKNEDGIALGPLFTDAKPSVQITKNTSPHSAGRPWHITAQIDHPNIEHASKDMLADLEGGASAIALNIDPHGKTGTAVRSVSDLQRVFSGVHANLVPIRLALGTFEQSALLSAYFKNHKKIENIHLSLGYTCADDDEDKLLSLTRWVSNHAPHWKAITINGATIHEAGASPAQELAYMLSKSVSLLRPMIKIHGLKAALNLIDIHLASDQDAHFGIVKFRAARMLWAKMTETFGARSHDKSIDLHAISSERMLAKTDPWANILRLNAACFGAVCGGANSITLLPFTHANGLATAFARRISRNLQLMQMEETRLGHVNDPAHGSYMHETLTHKLAAKAWKTFQKIETRGGWEQGKDWFMTEIAETNTKRLRKIEDGEILLVGVNQYAKPDVRKAEVLPHPKIKQRSGDVIDTNNFKDAIAQARNGSLLPLGHSHA